jgi:hypothetical protein
MSLFGASQKDDLELAKELLQAGASPTVRLSEIEFKIMDQKLVGALIHVKTIYDHPAEREYKAAPSALVTDLNSPASQDGIDRSQMPLHVAAFNNSRRVMLKLIQKGAPVNAEDSLGFTPIFYAAGRGHAQAVQLLIHAGAIPDYRTSMTTALHLAAANGDLETSRLLVYHTPLFPGWNRQLFLLIHQNPDGETSLHCAAQNGSFKLIEELIGAVANFIWKSAPFRNDPRWRRE